MKFIASLWADVALEPITRYMLGLHLPAYDHDLA